MAEEKRIVINGYIAEKFYGSNFNKQNPDTSLTKICNDLLEKLIKDEIVVLEINNLDKYKQCAAQMNTSTSFIANSLLSRIDPEPEIEPEKIKMKVTTSKQEVKIKVKRNSITSWT